MAKQDWLDYFDLLSKIADTLTELSGLQEEKKRSVEKGHLPRLEEIMKQEQVITMTLRGYEQKRLKSLPLLQVPPGSVSELEQYMPLELKAQGKVAVLKLQTSFGEYREKSQASKDTLEANLKLIEQRTGFTSDYKPGNKTPRQKLLEQEQEGAKATKPGNVSLNLRQFQKEKVETPKIVPVSQAQLAQTQREQDAGAVATVGGFNMGGSMSDLRQLAQQQEKDRLSALRQKTLQANADGNK